MVSKKKKAEKKELSAEVLFTHACFYRCPVGLPGSRRETVYLSHPPPSVQMYTLHLL